MDAESPLDKAEGSAQVAPIVERGRATQWDSEKAREAARRSWEVRRQRQAEAAERMEAALAATPSPPADPGSGDDESFRSVLRSIAADAKAPAAARVAAARAGLDMDDDAVVGLPPALFATLPSPWVAVIIEHQPADLGAAIALLVEHELASRLTHEPEPAPAQG